MSAQPTNQLQKYQAMKGQMPLLELTDITTSEVMEPFPAKAKSWYKVSRISIVVSLLILAAGVGILSSGIMRQVKSEAALGRGTPKTRTGIIQAATIMQNLQTSGVLDFYLQSHTLLGRITPALSGCSQWKLKQEDNVISLDYTLAPGSDPLEATAELNKAMQSINYVMRNPGRNAEIEDRRYNVSFEPRHE